MLSYFTLALLMLKFNISNFDIDLDGGTGISQMVLL